MRLLAACATLIVLLVAVDSAMHIALAEMPFGGPRPAAEPQVGGFVGWLLVKQSEFYREISATIRAAKSDGSAVWTLLLISFAYGIFHAAGPGHGKAVISSYLVANNETWRRGVALSFVSAAMQSVVAVIVVAVMAALLGATAKSIGSTVHVIEVVSYGLIVLIGLRLLFVKGRVFLLAFRDFRWREPQFEVLFPLSAGTAKLSAYLDGNTL